jgi:hypothetical protein
MEIVHNQNHNQSNSLTAVQGGKNNFEPLKNDEKDLLNDLSGAFSIIHGGTFKRRRQIA